MNLFSNQGSSSFGFYVTQFELNEENGRSRKQTPICSFDYNSNPPKNSCSSSNNDIRQPFNSCGTLTEAGTFLILGDDGNLFKLGKCGLEKTETLIMGPQSETPNSGRFCSKAPGGAIFCSSNWCTLYVESNQSTEALPYMNDYHSREIT